MGKARKRIRCPEGSCIAIPLVNGRFARVVVARVSSTRYLVSYCFAPSFPNVPPLYLYECLEPKDVLCAWKISSVGVADGDWPVLGILPRWRREDWPVPRFAFTDPLSGARYLRTYDDRDPSIQIAQERVPDDYEFSEEADASRGHVIAARVLTKRIEEWEARNL